MSNTFFQGAKHFLGGTSPPLVMGLNVRHFCLMPKVYNFYNLKCQILLRQFHLHPRFQNDAKNFQFSKNVQLYFIDLLQHFYNISSNFSREQEQCNDANVFSAQNGNNAT